MGLLFYLAPHTHTPSHIHTGGIALDPTYFNTTNATLLWEAWALHSACQEIGMTIAELKPDLVLLSTPHGVADLSQFMFYLNPEVLAATQFSCILFFLPPSPSVLPPFNSPPPSPSLLPPFRDLAGEILTTVSVLLAATMSRLRWKQTSHWSWSTSCG